MKLAEALDRRVTLGFHTYAPVPLEAFVDALIERAATTRGRFYLVEAMLERGRVSKTLARYVAAAKRRPRGPGTDR
jgi:hypothetical protein